MIVDYFGGRDGRVWLGASEAGNLAVLKFSRNHVDAQAVLEKEAALWEDIWGIKVKVCQMYKHPCLIMPFVFHFKLVDGIPKLVTQDGLPVNMTADSGEREWDGLDLSSVDPVETAREALTIMAKKGYRYHDVKLGHVGVLPVLTGGALQLYPVLIDLSDVSVDENVDVEELVNKLVYELDY